MEASEKIDLSGLALNLALRSLWYVALAFVAAFVVTFVAKFVGGTLSDRQFRILALAIFTILESKIVLRIRRLAVLHLEVCSNTRSLHAVEISVSVFLAFFSLARPYLMSSDAGAFPSVKILFEAFIGVLVLCHCLVLVIFQQKPGSWDLIALAASLVAAVLAIR
jgi:hypothetical protein